MQSETIANFFPEQKPLKIAVEELIKRVGFVKNLSTGCCFGYLWASRDIKCRRER